MNNIQANIKPKLPLGSMVIMTIPIETEQSATPIILFLKKNIRSLHITS